MGFLNMSDYGADPEPFVDHFHMLTHGYFFTGPMLLQADQYTIDEDTRVLKFCSGDGRVNVKFKVDPGQIAGV